MIPTLIRQLSSLNLMGGNCEFVNAKYHRNFAPKEHEVARQTTTEENL